MSVLNIIGATFLFIGIFFIVNNVFEFLDFGMMTVPCIVLIGLGCWFCSLAAKQKKSRQARKKSE